MCTSSRTVTVASRSTESCSARRRSISRRPGPHPDRGEDCRVLPCPPDSRGGVHRRRPGRHRHPALSNEEIADAAAEHADVLMPATPRARDAARTVPTEAKGLDLAAADVHVLDRAVGPTTSRSSPGCSSCRTRCWTSLRQVSPSRPASCPRFSPRRSTEPACCRCRPTSSGDRRTRPGQSSVAAAHHLSSRALQKLFQAQGLTVSGWIRDPRLERARKDLLRGRSIRRSR